MITVYHIDSEKAYNADRELYLDITMFTETSKIVTAIESGLYKKVAEVNSHELEDAYFLTNSIEDHWSQNEGVTQFGDRNKSSSMGDIMVYNNECFVVAAVGFTLLPQECLDKLQPSIKSRHKM